jgi:hypothetical protein
MHSRRGGGVGAHAGLPLVAGGADVSEWGGEGAQGAVTSVYVYIYVYDQYDAHVQFQIKYIQIPPTKIPQIQHQYHRRHQHHG